MVDDDSDSEENERGLESKNPSQPKKPLSSPMPSSSSTPSLLNKEQAEILKYVNRPESPSIFITGSAGVGKSFLLQEIIKSRKARWSGSAGAVAITAPTGIAASNIGGRTIHSFAGIGLGKGDEEKIIKKAAYAKTSRERWWLCETLVIDEISMLDSSLFEMLSQIAQEVKQNNRPFGGIQLILSGDFYQLPPVKGRFAFTSPLWAQAELRSFVLKEVIRQRGDSKFVNLLNKFRTGQIGSLELDDINECHEDVFKGFPNDGILPTKLYCKNRDVDAENRHHLAELKTKPITFRSRDVWKGNNRKKFEIDFLLQQIQRKVNDMICLKVGCQVMCLKNLPNEDLVNGSRGVVVGFEGNGPAYPIVKWTGDMTSTVKPAIFDQGVSGLLLQRMQLPLKLAWALTIHKCQGMTISRAEMKLSDAFESGQAYVALSRIESKDGLKLTGERVTQKDVRTNAAVTKFYATLDNQQGGGEKRKAEGGGSSKPHSAKRKDHHDVGDDQYCMGDTF
ncbi:hypothetical protein TrCOL_g11895 [Triparma columacea]|uniref:ATP-dependent DNA helicase n=1 Tax=Triparma columacea TaxID=722753 RepID=A0A9W7GCM4_9STRA|nr:hypothetical protein TrCOL_g11895 [Triparma columacea]